MPDILWKQWQADWKRMEEIARRRGWDVTPLAIAPPATEAAVQAVEARHGITVPPQLRELLTRYSAHVTFGWGIPSHLYPMERQNLPTASTNHTALWNLRHMDADAIPNFLGWKKALAAVDISEAPNQPEIWEHQFPFYTLGNGDMLTIDTSKPEGPHPVRYFSHELEMLHGMALAPDFFSFVTEMSKLGFAGTEWSSWGNFGICNEAENTFHIRADSIGGKAWLVWLAADPAQVQMDEPPPAIVEETPAERAFLNAARVGDIAGVEQALSDGARSDVVPSSDWLMKSMAWNDEFSTALTYAIRANNIALAEKLLAGGATLDTRRLIVGDAVQAGSPETLRWLIERGARVNGWKDDRHWPLHLLVTRRSEMTAPTQNELEVRLREEFNLPTGGASSVVEREMHKMQEKLIQDRLEAWLDRPSYLSMLEMLLKAGANPDARWDNGITMLTWAREDDGEVLLRAGANVHTADSNGNSALYSARTPAKVRLLVAHGADVNACPTPDAEAEESRTYTPLQSALLQAWVGDIDKALTLLELGADPHKRDSKGHSTLCYCTTIESFRLIAGYGIDPMERIPGGGTLLHNLLRTSGVRASNPNEVAFLDFLLGLGLPINAEDDDGNTALHIAAERVRATADIALFLDRGADKTIRNHKGKRPADLAPKSQTEIRQLLRWLVAMN